MKIRPCDHAGLSSKFFDELFRRRRRLGRHGPKLYTKHIGWKLYDVNYMMSWAGYIQYKVPNWQRRFHSVRWHDRVTTADWSYKLVSKTISIRRYLTKESQSAHPISGRSKSLHAVLNCPRESLCHTSAGKEFQTRGPAAAKHRSSIIS